MMLHRLQFVNILRLYAEIQKVHASRSRAYINRINRRLLSLFLRMFSCECREDVLEDLCAREVGKVERPPHIIGISTISFDGY